MGSKRDGLWVKGIDLRWRCDVGEIRIGLRHFPAPIRKKIGGFLAS